MSPPKRLFLFEHENEDENRELSPDLFPLHEDSESPSDENTPAENHPLPQVRIL